MKKKDMKAVLELRVRRLVEKRKQLHEAIKENEDKTKQATESYARTDIFYRQMQETTPRSYKAESHASALEYRGSEMCRYRQLAQSYKEQDRLLEDEIIFLNNLLK